MVLLVMITKTSKLKKLNLHKLLNPFKSVEDLYNHNGKNYNEKDYDALMEKIANEKKVLADQIRDEFESVFSH